MNTAWCPAARARTRRMATNQNNTININESGSRRNLIEAINKAKNNKEKNV